MGFRGFRLRVFGFRVLRFRVVVLPGRAFNRRTSVKAQAR